MSSGAPMYYIGCRLSLMSKAKLRYEGTLAGIDTEKCTVELHNVQSFGTEDRVPPPNVIPPTPGSYDLIIFNGHDLDDLKVIPDRNPIEMQDPAIINAPKRNEKRADSGKNNNDQNNRVSPVGKPVSAIGQKPSNNAHVNNNNRNRQSNTNSGSMQNNNNNNIARTNSKKGNDDIQEKRGPSNNADQQQNQKPVNAWKTGNLAQKTRDQRDQRNRYEERREEIQRQKLEREKKEKADLEKYKQTEFDFNAGLAKFEKEAVAKDGKKDGNDAGDKEIAQKLAAASLEEGEIPAEKADKKSKKKSKKYYDAKTSIFDNISSEVADAESAKAARLPRFQERKLNSETFGIPEKPMFYNNRGGNNDGNRGGYNNNRQGGYNNNRQGGYNNNNRGYNNNRQGGYNNNNRGVNSGYNRDNRSAGIGGGYVRGRNNDSRQ